MSNTLYYELVDTNDALGAAELLNSNTLNMALLKVNSAVHIYSSIDVEITEKENPDLTPWMKKNLGKGNIDVDAYSNEQADSIGYELEDILEMQTEVFIAIAKSFEIRFMASSSGFDLSNESFSLDQIKRITCNGTLLDNISESRVLYSQLIDMPVAKKASKKEFNKLLKSVKENSEDMEWYPTTTEIIDTMYWDIKAKDMSSSGTYHTRTSVSILDIGAGNGKLFKTIKEISDANPDVDDRDNRNYPSLNISKSYAIEKSQTLINSLDSNIFVIGTDFHQQTLIDKEVDVLFCNPPYSEFKTWTHKIIKEANAKYIYMVIPQRWESDIDIAKAIEVRKGSVTVVGSFDFLDAEDRIARAVVDLVKVDLTKKKRSMYDDERRVTDPFDIWFDEVFHVDVKHVDDYEKSFAERDKKARRIKNLVIGKSLIPRLEELYTEELQHYMENYSKIAGLDTELLKEIGVSTKSLKEALKLKISGLKNLYWKELFDNLDTITSRLTSKSRGLLLDTLLSHTSVDFTASNAYSIVLWAIKNANQYFDSQLLELYYSFSNSSNIKNYKSNKKLIEDGWRYQSNHHHKKHSHYSLDYRIVVGGYFSNAFEFDYDGNVRGLTNNAQISVQDLMTVATNLGYNAKDNDLHQREWVPGKNQFFTMSTGSDSKETLVEIKAFKKGTMHYRFTQGFMAALNIEAARLNGWIKSPKEASEEFDITEEEATEKFGCNFELAPSNISMLPAPKKEEHKELTFEAAVTTKAEPKSNIGSLLDNEITTVQADGRLF